MTRHESLQSEESAVGLRFLYRPGARDDAPLVVLVHGRAGNRSVMWTFERGIPEDCHVVAFEGFLADPIGGWSWWDMALPGSKRDAIVLAAGRLTKAIESFIKLYSLRPERLLGMGFSQGSVLLSAVALRGFVEFDGIAVLAGFVFQPETPLKLAKVPSVFIAHGTEDQTIPVSQARDGVEALKKLGVPVQYVEEDVGHKIGIQGTRALKAWIVSMIAGE